DVEIDRRADGSNCHRPPLAGPTARAEIKRDIERCDRRLLDTCGGGFNVMRSPRVLMTNDIDDIDAMGSTHLYCDIAVVDEAVVRTRKTGQGVDPQARSARSRCKVPDTSLSSTGPMSPTLIPSSFVVSST